jgi:hypothetical protein
VTPGTTLLALVSWSALRGTARAARSNQKHPEELGIDREAALPRSDADELAELYGATVTSVRIPCLKCPGRLQTNRYLPG